MATIEGYCAARRQGTPHWVNDPGHGWLAVPAEKVRDIAGKVSAYSYLQNGWAYLEEDCDAALYIEASGIDVDAIPEFYAGDIDSSEQVGNTVVQPRYMQHFDARLV